ncbi:MAG TPA: GNAT family N-acetyltransferase [Verrucomicrobiae bacterium]|nr:GNAT family N-acetyltransferase [Verrucomicrobiae bacterium]
MQILHVNPLAGNEWAESLAQHPRSGVFQSIGWAAVLHDTYGFSPCYFVARENDCIEAALPLMEINSPLTGKRGISLPFTDDCPPLSVSADALKRTFAEVLKEGKRRTWKYCEWRGGEETGKALIGPNPSQTFFNHRLYLLPETETMFAKFESSVRRAIRKAEKSGVQTEVSNNPDSVKAFYRLHCQTRQRHGLPPQPFRFFSNIHRHLLSQNVGMIVSAIYRGHAIAAALFLDSGREAVYKFGASDFHFQELRANNLVMWAAIKHWAAAGKRVLDFGRTSPANDGLRRYKLSWGTTECNLNYYRYDFRQGTFTTTTDAAHGWHNHFFQRLPRPLAILAGRMLYPHIA